jgi:hypothetical protein
MGSRTVRLIVQVGLLVVEAVGAVLLGLALNPSPSSGSAQSTSASYTAPAPCSGCAVSLQSVEVQQRANGTLFVVKGTLPKAPDELGTSVKIEAQGLDAVLRPQGDGFALSHATFDGQPMVAGTIAAAIQNGALLLFVRNGVLTTPTQFALGTWNGSAYVSRLPQTGTLVWTPGSALSHGPAAVPTPSADENLVTGMAHSCPTIPFGTTPADLALGDLSSGNATDPRRMVPVNFVGVSYAKPLPLGFRSEPPFSAAIVVEQQGSSLPAGGLAVDRMGQVQLWAVWDGTNLHKALRQWNGSGWSTLVDASANDLTLDMSSNGVTFFWPGLKPGEHAAALLAVDGGCAAAGISSAGHASTALIGLS